LSDLFVIDEDDTYQYRHVILDKGMVSLIPKNRLMDECEWRALGIKQGSHWEHYLIHKPGKIHLFKS
jgi:cyclin-dependent kinase regulatory subunit CKS1